MTITVGREWRREPRREWQAALDQWWPPSARFSSFRILWEPGDPWQPVERWCIWTVWPQGQWPSMVEPFLFAPHPRSTGHYCADGWCACEMEIDPVTLEREPKPECWVGGPVDDTSHVSARQWELFHETGRFHSRFWVLQGEGGGHQFRFTPFQRTVAQMKLGITDPPDPGTLPYAEPDRRTFEQLAAADLLLRADKRIGATMDALRQPLAVIERDRRAEAERAMALMWDWMGEQLGASVERMAWALRRADLPRPRVDAAKPIPRDPDLFKEGFLQSHPNAPRAA